MRVFGVSGATRVALHKRGTATCVLDERSDAGLCRPRLLRTGTSRRFSLMLSCFLQTSLSVYSPDFPVGLARL